MPSWKKVILSGSDAALNTLSVSNSITASVISASQFTGSLFGTSSWAIRAVSSSYLSGSTAIINNATVNNLTVNTNLSWNPGNPSTILGFNELGNLISGIPGINWYEDNSIFDRPTSFRVGVIEPSPGQYSGSHILKDGRELFTNARAIEDNEPFTILGFAAGPAIILDDDPLTQYKVQVPPFYNPGDVYAGSLTLGTNNFYGINSNGGTNTNLINNGSYIARPSSPGLLMGQGGLYIFQSASMQFSPSGALLSPVASASVKFTLASDSSSLSISVGKNDLREVLFISRSENFPRIGIGKSTSNASLDISGSVIITGSLTASGDVSIRGFSSVSASLASLSSGVGTLQQVTTAGNTTSNAISSSFPGVGFFGTASWAINVVNGGGGGGGGSDSAFLNQSTAATTWSFAHNLGTQYPVITVYDTSGQVIIPQEIDGEDTNNLKIYFPTSQSGYATAVGGTSALTYYSQSLTTASVNLNIITFTKGDSTQFSITVNTGSGGGGGGSDFPYTGSAIISGSLTVTGSVISTGGFTGSLFGTSSWAINALTAALAPNYVLNSQTSSMLAPYVLNSQTSSFVVNSQTSSFVLNSQTSSMLAPYVLNSQTSSFVRNSQTSSMTVLSSSFASTASFINNLNQNLSITGAVILSGSSLPELRVIGETQFTGSVGSTGGFTGSLLGTSSWASNAITASYILNAISSSFASTASYVLNAVSSSFSLTASFTPNAITTASVNLNTITFTKGSGTTFNITVDTGSGGGGGGSVTINNNVDNYIITATGTANTLNGEVGLQYSGSILINASRSQFGGAAVVDTTHQFRGLSSDTYAGFLIQDPDGEDIFKTEGSIANSTLAVSIGDFNNISNGTGINIDVANDDILLRGKLVADNTKGITGSLFGTASWATNALTASNLTPAITNNTDNRVLTATGAGSINGEANLTFDGSLLDINGDIQFNENRIRTSSTTVGQPGKGADLAYDWGNFTTAPTAGRIVYYASGSGGFGWRDALASATGSSIGPLGVATNAASQDEIMLRGAVRVSGSLSGLAAGQIVYLSNTVSGSVTGSAPSTTGHIVRIIGYVISPTDNTMYFNPDFTWIEII